VRDWATCLVSPKLAPQRVMVLRVGLATR
jgi:hypothetical protein